MKKSLLISTLLSVLIITVGCGSVSNSNEISGNNSEEIITDATIAEQETVESEKTELRQEKYEKNASIVNLLKTGFSFDGMETPIINFVSETNTYVVIAPTSSNSIGLEFEASNGGEEWEKYVDNFTELTNQIISTISNTNDIDKINFRITHTLKTPMPLISYQNGDVVYDRYNAEESDKAIFALKTQCDLNFIDTVGDTDIEYDSTKNNYTVNFYHDNIEDFKDEDVYNAFSEMSGVFESVIESYGNPTVTVNALESSTNKLICTVENDKYTYNIFD